jgi:hypothetical protein
MRACAVAGAALFAAIGPAPAQGALSFTAPTTKAVGDAPGRGIAVADFNGDSDPDLAVANRNSDNVSILLGGTGATFSAKTDFPIGDFPDAIAVGDFNGDLDPDLAVVGPGNTFPAVAGYVAVLLGGTGGSFGTATKFTTGSNPVAVAVGRFNADNDPDLAVVNQLSHNVSVLLGGAGGSFGAQTPFATAESPRSIAVGDFNADNDPDLAVASFNTDGVSVLLGGAAGAFGAKTDFPAGDGPRSVAVGDFNADSDPDLAVGNAITDTVSILRGGTGGTFGPKTDFAAGDGQWVSVGSLNHDSFPDLALADLASGASILRGQPGGAFRPPMSFPAGAAASSLALGNFDGDGDTDLAVTNLSTDTVSILRNTSTAVAEVRLTPAALDFGPQIVNTASVARAVKVTNVGDANLRVGDVGVAGVNSEDFELKSQSCLGRTIAPGGECIARVSFTPTTPGARTAGLLLSSNALGRSHTASLEGTGVMPTCFGQRATIVGTDGSDVVAGTSGNDVVVLLGGDDIYDPFFASEFGGDDWVCGGAGDDRLTGNFDPDAGSAGGDDHLFGGSDDDALQGDSGEDFLRGGSGDDFVDGGADGPDTGDDFDQCFGDSGTDASAECEGLDGFE